MPRRDEEFQKVLAVWEHIDDVSNTGVLLSIWT